MEPKFLYINVFWYNEDGSEETQPTTPLKICVLRLSDCIQKLRSGIYIK